MQLIADLRYALRTLRLTPAFTFTAVAVLALGIGANTAMFTVANAVLLRPLRFASPDRLVLITGSDLEKEAGPGRISYPFFTIARDHNRSFSGLAACTFETFNLTGHGDPEQIASARTSWNFFDILGVRPFAGRTFIAEEDNPGSPDVVLLGYELAKRLFDDPRRAVGQSIALNSRDVAIIGVLPSGFSFSLFGAPRQIWAARPFDMSLVTPARVALGGTYFNAIGRLRDGIPREQADSEMRLLYQRYKHEKPRNFDATLNMTIRAGNLRDLLVAGVRPALLTLTAAVAFVLLIGCANVASLLLSRALARKHEFAIRTALGASRRDLIRQVFTESALIALVSGAAGLMLGRAGTRVLTALNADILQPAGLSLDPAVLAFALAVSLLTAVLFGLAPALQVSKTGIHSAFRGQGRGMTVDRLRERSRSALVIAQVALSMVLLVGAGLLIRSFVRLRAVSPGFDPGGVLTMQIPLSTAKYKRPGQIIAFYRSTLERVENLPGVRAAAISTALPLTPTHLTPALFEDQPAVALGQRPIVNIQQISPGYTKVMHVALLAGRAFNEADTADAPKVAIVNQSAVRRFWPNGNPIGKRIWLGAMHDPFQVVGVFADTKNNGLTNAPAPEILMPFPQLTVPYLSLSVRTASDPLGLAPAVRREIAAVDRDQPVTDVRTMQDYVESLTGQQRFTMLLLSVFSAAAFLLAAIGIYGVIAYSVARRSKELGIRIALGADKQDIVRMVTLKGIKLTLAGIAIGAAAATVLTRIMASLLYQTSAQDPLTFIAAAVAFTAVAGAASYVPARRATRIDPCDALRAE